MSIQAYLIDTNIIIGLEDNRTVQPALAALCRIAAQHRVRIFVHEVARDDILRDRNKNRRNISLSKLQKYQLLGKVRGLKEADLAEAYGPLRNSNDRVDATLLHTLKIGAADFLVTEDNGLHDRAQKYSPELGERVLHVADAVDLLLTTFEPKTSPVRYVEEVSADTIGLTDDIFDSLRADYSGFDDWWRNKCVREHRCCWVVYDDGLAGIIVRKDETPATTDATLPAQKILKICTFKVRPENRGVKLGELLLKQVFWFAQVNAYDLVYITAYEGQESLINLLEYYGFKSTATKEDGERIYEKLFSQGRLERRDGQSIFLTDRLYYPRFISGPNIRAFGVPIKEAYHDTLYPDLKNVNQLDFFGMAGIARGSRRPGNTIRKVYLCRAQSNLGPPGSLLFFYKGKSTNLPSQAMTAVGVFENLDQAFSTTELMRLAGGRSVYSEQELEGWNASGTNPVKVINYLLSGYINPPLSKNKLLEEGIFRNRPPQSIFEIRGDKLNILLAHLNLGFEV